MILSDLLALYPVLGKLPPALQQRIVDAMQTMTVPGATAVFDERQPCRGFPFVLGGAIRVVKISASGRELPLYRVLAGESCIISSSCLLGHADYNARGISEGETTLALLPLEVTSTCRSRPDRYPYAGISMLLSCVPGETLPESYAGSVCSADALMKRLRTTTGLVSVMVMAGRTPVVFGGLVWTVVRATT